MSLPRKSRLAVLHILPSLDRAAGGDSLLALFKGLREEGWEVLVAAAASDVERELQGVGIRFVSLSVDRHDPLRIWLNSRQLARLIHDNQVAVVHAHGRAAAWSGALAAKKSQAALLTTIHRLPPAAGSRWRRRYDAIMTAGDRVVVPSDYLAETLQQRLPVETARLRIIRAGVDLASFDPASVRGHRLARLSERWQLSLDHRIVLLPGPVREGGGQLDMLKVMAGSTRRDWQLLIVGELDKGSAYVKALERTILADGLAERVVFGGACDDMPAAFMMADLVALPASIDDGHAILAVQAQAMGKPVLVTDCGALPEAVMPAATGWLVPQGDHAKMGWALDLALDMDEDVRARLLLRARDFVAEEFSVAQMVRRTAALYRELVRDAPRPSVPTS